MLLAPKLHQLNDLVNSLSKDELIWMNGYLSGLLAQQVAPANVNPVETIIEKQVQKITIAYGTETGNAKKLATHFAGSAKKAGNIVKLVALDQYKTQDLSKEENFLLIISTQGDGEPPVGAKKFYDFIHEQNINLSSLKISILALGDSSYPLYCKAGEDVYERLISLGATPIIPLIKADVDYATTAQNWLDETLNALASSSKQSISQNSLNIENKPVKSGKSVYNGKVQHIVNLKDIHSNRKTYHIEIAVDGSVEYEPGDSLGIHPKNPVVVVDEILQLLSIDSTQTIEYRKETYTIYQFLLEKANLLYLSKRVIKQYAQLTNQEIPDTRMGLLDLLKIYPSRDKSVYAELIQHLEPNAPRLYSISSSPLAHEGEIHITVALDTFYVSNELKSGLCSTQLSLWKEGEDVQFYIQKNHHFKLPNDDQSIIMIGPGTGIAPFRSFLLERDQRGATGKNWLFFGEQRFVSDFLYQTEIQNWYQVGLLQNVHLAFSRDQTYKIYVQHRILEKAKEFWEWIQAGAIIYICGSKDPMSKDVLNAIATVIERFGGFSTIAAWDKIEQLQSEGKILLDVY